MQTKHWAGCNAPHRQRVAVCATASNTLGSRVESPPPASVTIPRRALLAAGGAMSFPSPLWGPLPAPAAACTDAAATPACVPRATLGASGVTVSRIRKGCWQLSGGHRGDRSSDRTSGSAAVEDFQPFVDAGITSFDAADHYGPAEALIGRYLATHAEERGKVQVLTKYCLFTGADMATLSARSVAAAVDTSLQRLGLPCVDVMQLYWGDYGYPGYVDAGLYLSDLAVAGKLRAVGVTNMDVARCEAMARAGVRLASNQVQYSLLDTRPENGMAAWAAAHDMALLPYGVLAGGFLSDRYLGVGAADVSVDTYSKGKYARVIGARGGWAWFQRLLETLASVGAKHSGASIASVATRWVLDRPGVAGVILGARNATHVADQSAVFGLALDDDDRGVIAEALASGTLPKGDCYTWERGGAW